MLDRDSLHKSSVPQLLREDDDENDEILIFDEDAFGVDEEYEYGIGLDENLPPGYSIGELEHQVTFVRSSKNPETGAFDLERKNLLWCIEHGCEEVQPGVWSGFWYFTFLFGEQEGRRSWVDAMNKRLVKEGGGKAVQIDHEDYGAMLYNKEKGKRAFYRGQYKIALDCYIKGEALMGGDVTGMYLVPHQRADMVTLLSNQAECYLRMKKYEDAMVQASRALQLDRRHKKSLLRRAKAVLYGCEPLALTHGKATVRTSISDDLEAIVGMDGPGTKEAQLLLSEMDEKLAVSS